MASVSLRGYWQMLRQHDWTHGYSDDSSVYQAGRDNQRKLAEITAQSPDHAALFKAMERWGWKQGELPQQPEAEAA